MTSSELLTAPGRWLADAFVPLEAGADETEARADLVVTLGLGLWVVALAPLALSWRRWGTPSGHTRARAPRGAAPRTGLKSTHATVLLTAGRTAWGVLWRAQVVHALVYGAAPVLWEAARQFLLVITLPFSLMGFGDRTGPSGAWLDHLSEPGCWTFATACHWPSIDGAIWSKLAWAFLSLAWAAHWQGTWQRR